MYVLLECLIRVYQFWRSGYGRFDYYSVRSMHPLNVREAPAPLAPLPPPLQYLLCAGGCPHFQFCVVYEPPYAIFVVYSSVALTTVQPYMEYHPTKLTVVWGRPDFTVVFPRTNPRTKLSLVWGSLRLTPITSHCLCSWSIYFDYSVKTSITIAAIQQKSSKMVNM